MKTRKSVNTLAIIGCVLATMGAAIAHRAAAADTVTGKAGAQAAGDEAIQEIVVTANKRTENVQDVAAAVSVASGEQLDQRGFRGLADYAADIPGFNVSSMGSPGRTAVSMRGISSNTPTSAVGTYLDDTPVGSSSSWASGSTTLLDMLPYDLERIEVLRGPQGTLYGQGSMGGLIKYVLKAPSLREFESSVGADVNTIAGSGEAGYAVRARVSAPVIDDVLGVTVSAFGRQTPGYITNIYTGEENANETRQYGARIGALWRPRSDLSVKLTALTQVIDADDSAYRHFADATPVPNSSVLMIRPSNPLADLTENLPFPTSYNQRIQFLAATIDWDLGNVDFVSATSWSKQTSLAEADVTPLYGVLLPFFGTAGEGLAKVHDTFGLEKITQELRLMSPQGRRVEWLAGVFATHESSFTTYAVPPYTLDYQPYPGLPSPPGIFHSSYPAKYNEYAAFGNLTWNVTEEFSLTGGLRYSQNDQKIAFDTLPAPIWPPPLPRYVNIDTDEDVLTWMGSAQYHLTKSAMAYARIATGYRAGGPNSPIPTVPLAYDSDSLMTYELGLKSSVLDNRALINVAVYRTHWKDIQLGAVSASGYFYRTNGGKARSQGVEVETQFSPVKGLTVGLNGAYTDTYLTSVIPESSFLLTGYQLPQVPKQSGSATVEYNFPLAATWSGWVGGAYRYVGSQYASLAQSPSPVSSPTFRTKAYSVVDANAGVRKDQLTIRMTARNLADSHALIASGTQRTNSITGASDILVSFLQPRTLELGFDYSF